VPGGSRPGNGPAALPGSGVSPDPSSSLSLRKSIIYLAHRHGMEHDA
jgi:hypothetical protein